jgi:hypothetical protein
MPWIRKVWIFGDRPLFLTADTDTVEHLSHERIAWIGGFASPIRNFFVMYYLSALWPELTPEYIRFSDDFIVLSDMSVELASRVRFLKDMSRSKGRGQGPWHESLWHTHDVLKRLGYPVLNYETHTPAYFRKEWAVDAFRDLRDYVSEDRWFGLTGATAILNHAWQRHRMPLTRVSKEHSRFGYYGNPPSYEDVKKDAVGKLFLNFDDKAFGSGLRQFLAERFPTPSRFEIDGDGRPAQPALPRRPQTELPKTGQGGYRTLPDAAIKVI